MSEAFVDGLDMGKLGFVRAEPADTGHPGYDPRDLLKLYLYGYLQQVRSSRRLEGVCQRNVEVMWLLGRLTPDYKSIAEFRRMHSQAVTEAGAELVRLARSVGLVVARRWPWMVQKYRIFGNPRFLLAAGRAGGDQFGDHGLQLETHAERPRAVQLRTALAL